MNVTTFPCLRACRARRSNPVACSSSVGIPEKSHSKGENELGFYFCFNYNPRDPAARANRRYMSGRKSARRHWAFNLFIRHIRILALDQDTSARGGRSIKGLSTSSSPNDLHYLIQTLQPSLCRRRKTAEMATISRSFSFIRKHLVKKNSLITFLFAQKHQNRATDVLSDRYSFRNAQ